MPPHPQPRTIYRVLGCYYKPSTMHQAYLELGKKIDWEYLKMYTFALLDASLIRLKSVKTIHEEPRYSRPKNESHFRFRRNGRSPSEQLEDQFTDAILENIQPKYRNQIKRKLANNPGKTPAEKVEYHFSVLFMNDAPKQNSLIYFGLHPRFKGHLPSESTFLHRIYPELILPSAKAIRDPALRKAEFEARRQQAMTELRKQYFS